MPTPLMIIRMYASVGRTQHLVRMGERWLWKSRYQIRFQAFLQGRTSIVALTVRKP